MTGNAVKSSSLSLIIIQLEYSSQLAAKGVQLTAKDSQLAAKDAENSRLGEDLKSLQV